MQRMRRRPENDAEGFEVSGVAESLANGWKSNEAIRNATDKLNEQPGLRMQNRLSVGREDHAPSIVETPSRRRLKKLSELSRGSDDSARILENVVEIEDDSPQPDLLSKNKQSAGRRNWSPVGDGGRANALVEQLGGLSIDKVGVNEAACPAQQRSHLNQILKVSRQQVLPDDDHRVSGPRKQHWTDWPEPSGQGTGQGSATVDPSKAPKARHWSGYTDLEEAKKFPGSGWGHASATTMCSGANTVSVSSSTCNVADKEKLQAVAISRHCAERRGGELRIGAKDSWSEGSSSTSERSSGGLEHHAKGAKDSTAPARPEALLAPDQNAIVLGKGKYCLPGRIARQLYPHQRESIEWLWSLHVKKTGGILGDDMGLGKTMQIASYLSGLFHSRLIHCVLIVAPKTLLAQWELELSEKCGMGRQVLSYHEGSPAERAWNLRHTFQQGGILLTTYGMIQHNAIPLAGLDPEIGKDGFGDMADDMVTWDYVVLDEGHQIKNEKTVKAKNLRSIPARHRLIVSGTPVQNNLQEMWSLFDFCCPTLLGDSRSFKDEYERKITAGQNRDATERQRHVGVVTSQRLRAVIAPFFLRREKKDVIKTSDPGSAPNPSPSAGVAGAAQGQRQMDMRARKNDLIVWLKPTPEQKRLYVSFLQSEQVKKVFNEKRSALAALTVLKKICDHPLLLTERAASEIARGAARAADGPSDELTEGDAAAAAALALEIARARGISLGGGRAAAEASCKVLFLMELLEDLTWAGHRTLVFSQSKKMLDIIQAEVVARDFRFCRIDGSIVSARERQKLVEEFQTDPDIPVFLLTSQVGGLGLTLTAADRVVIIDPAWNPSVDNQSVDRAYRIGQARDVVVYRLITAGTIEEKIYCKQVFKGGLMRAVTEHKDYKKMFNENELRALFSIPERGFEHSETMERLHKSQAGVVDTMPELDQHIARLETRGIVGVSHHDLLFKEAAEGVPIVATVGAAAARATSAPARRQFVDLTGRGSRKGGLSALPSARANLLSEAHAFLKADGDRAPGFWGLGSHPANPWTVPAESPERSEERKAAEAELAAQKRVEGLAQELKKAERLLKSQAQSLPDGGEKIQHKIRRLSDQLHEARIAATKPLSPEIPASGQEAAAAAARFPDPGTRGPQPGDKAGSSAAAAVLPPQRPPAVETGLAPSWDRKTHVPREDERGEGDGKSGTSSRACALEVLAPVDINQLSALQVSSGLASAPRDASGLGITVAAGTGGKEAGSVEGRRLASGGAGTASRGVDATTPTERLPVGSADVGVHVISAGVDQRCKLVKVARVADDVRPETRLGFLKEMVASKSITVGGPPIRSHTSTVAPIAQPAAAQSGLPVGGLRGKDPETCPADSDATNGATVAGPRMRDESTFGTPARVGTAQGPRSNLKLRASLRKRRKERGSLQDSPPGGMPTFDLGLDDLDEVADKLGSLSVLP